MTKDALQHAEHGDYFARYIGEVNNTTSLKPGLRASKLAISDFFRNIPQNKHTYAYADGKWTVKEAFQHLIDTERLFAHRLFRISRGDKTPLPSFDQDIYVSPSKANQKSMDDLVGEFVATRDYTISLVDSLSDGDLAQIGTSSDHPLSARAAGFIILGHAIWHMKVIRERYLP